MPFVLIISGSVLLVAAVRNTQQQLFYLLARDFTGQDNFVYWMFSILVIGALGYIPRLKPVSDGFLVLVILVLFLKKGTGFFDAFNRQIGSTQSASPVVSTTGTTAVQGTGLVNVFTGGGNQGGPLQSILGGIGGLFDNIGGFLGLSAQRPGTPPTTIRR